MGIGLPTDIEHAKDCVVVISLQLEIRLEAGEPSIPNVRTIYEAEEVQDGDGGNDVKVDLEPKPGLSGLVECQQRPSKVVGCGVAALCS